MNILYEHGSIITKHRVGFVPHKQTYNRPDNGTDDDKI